MNPEESQSVLSYGRSPPRWHQSLPKWAAIILLSVGCVYLGLKLLDRAFEPSVYTNLTRAQALEIPGLPPDAARINYRIGGAMDPCPLIYEFDTSLQSFREWARSNGWELREGDGEIRRFDQTFVTIDPGLFYSKLTSPDSGDHAAYDLDTGRAYYYAHSR